MALLTSFGLLSYLGYLVNPIAVITPFLVLSIGAFTFYLHLLFQLKVGKEGGKIRVV